jgi:hypothetical protein
MAATSPSEILCAKSFDDRGLSHSPAHRSGQGCSSCAGRGSESRAPVRLSRPTSGSSCPSIAACVKSRLNSAKQRSFFGPVHWHLLSCAARQAPRAQPKAAIPAPAGFQLQRISPHADTPKKQMLGAYVLVTESLRFLGGVVENALALLAKRYFHRSGNALANGDARFNFLCEWIRSSRACAETGSPAPYLRGAGLAAGAPSRYKGCRTGSLRTLRKKYHASSFLCIAFKHESPALSRGLGRGP